MIKINNLVFVISLIIFIQCSKSEDFENVNTGIYDGTDFNYAGEVIQINNMREIFVDHYLIDSLKGTYIVMHTPHDEGVVMNFNQPWEGKSCTYTTIIKEGNLYRAYYRGSGNTCYAESYDGINWVKPSLGLYEFSGSKENNIILIQEPFTHNFSPFLDQRPGIPDNQKFKAIAGERSDEGIFPGGLYAFVSGDGIHWRLVVDKPVLKYNPELHGSHAFDSQNVSFWSEEEQCYILYFRHWKTDHGSLRSIGRAKSEDFLNWVDESATFPAPNMPFEHLYTQQTSPYFRAPQIYISIGARFRPDIQVLTKEQLENLQVSESQFMGISEPYFMSSRGNNGFERILMDAFIRPGIGNNNWTARTNYPALNVVQTDMYEMSVYVNQDYTQPTAHLQRYSMRLDGFSSVYGPYEGGEIITKPFKFTGSQLEINYSTSITGEIRFEIQDPYGNPVPGFKIQTAKTIIGNEIAKIVPWSGNLNDLELMPVRLRIYLKNANLYSLKFN